MAGDLHAWALSRAPELLARAEAEAVAVLCDALVDAALGGGAAAKPQAKRQPESQAKPATEPPRRPAEPERAGDRGHLVWAYCVVPADTPAPDAVVGVDSRFEVERVVAGPLAALVSRVGRAEFDAEALRENLNELSWLERVARAHEAVLDQLLPETPLVPLRLCTLYEDARGVQRMLEKQRAVLVEALEGVAGRQEWAVKLLVDQDCLQAYARESSSEARSMAAEIDGLSEAGAYMLKRRLERHVREVADQVADEVSTDLFARLESSGVEFVTRPPQNRDLSGHEGEMLLNAACLVDASGLERLRDLAGEIQARHGRLGARVEITGPWPPYNFVLGGDAATLA